MTASPADCNNLRGDGDEEAQDDRSTDEPRQRLEAGPVRRRKPLDDVQYLECKLILKTDEFTSPKGFRKYAKLVAQAAKECGVGFDTASAKGARPAIREVMFLDTEDFRLYNNAFILRRRVRFEDGFPAEEPEVVFKFRHPDQQQAAEVDVRPNLPGDYRIKFKAEALPLKERLGGYRLLYSHNVQFPLSHAPGWRSHGDGEAGGDLPRAEVGEAERRRDRVSLVNQTIVEEVLQDLGTLDFGKGVTADANVALWRTRGEHLPLVGEFAYPGQVQASRRTCTTRRASAARSSSSACSRSAAHGSISEQPRRAWSIASRAIRRRPTSNGAARVVPGSQRP